MSALRPCPSSRQCRSSSGYCCQPPQGSDLCAQSTFRRASSSLTLHGILLSMLQTFRTVWPTSRILLRLFAKLDRSWLTSSSVRSKSDRIPAFLHHPGLSSPGTTEIRSLRLPTEVLITSPKSRNRGSFAPITPATIGPVCMPHRRARPYGRSKAAAHLELHLVLHLLAVDFHFNVLKSQDLLGSLAESLSAQG